MKTVQRCLVEVEGYPNYRDEVRFVVELDGQVLYGPYKTEQEAQETLKWSFIKRAPLKATTEA